MRLPTITGEFRLADDPELRFTPNGKAVTNVTLVASESKRNADDTGWEDGDRTPFIRAAIWNSKNGTEAEDVAEHFVRGERVLVTGQLYSRQFERNDGSKGESVELKWATIAAIPNGKPRGSGGGNSGGGGYNTRPAQRQQQDDPWATPNSSDEPPF